MYFFFFFFLVCLMISQTASLISQTAAFRWNKLHFCRYLSSLYICAWHVKKQGVLPIMRDSRKYIVVSFKLNTSKLFFFLCFRKRQSRKRRATFIELNYQEIFKALFNNSMSFQNIFFSNFFIIVFNVCLVSSAVWRVYCSTVNGICPSSMFTGLSTAICLLHRSSVSWQPNVVGW